MDCSHRNGRGTLGPEVSSLFRPGGPARRGRVPPKPVLFAPVAEAAFAEPLGDFGVSPLVAVGPGESLAEGPQVDLEPLNLARPRETLESLRRVAIPR